MARIVAFAPVMDPVNLHAAQTLRVVPSGRRAGTRAGRAARTSSAARILRRSASGGSCCGAEGWQGRPGADFALVCAGRMALSVRPEERAARLATAQRLTWLTRLSRRRHGPKSSRTRFVVRPGGPIMRSPFSFSSRGIAIDLGTANTVVYVSGVGIVASEPSVVTMERGNRRKGAGATGGGLPG